IGIATDGVTALGNSGSNGVGIRVFNGLNNTIGGTAAGAGNVISGNASWGVLIDQAGGSSTGNLVQGNFIGTDAGGTVGIPNLGVTSASATSNGTTTTVQTTFVAAANTTYNMQVFGNVTCDPSGFGEGQTLLGSVNVATNGGGVGILNQAFPTNVPTGQFVTA